MGAAGPSNATCLTGSCFCALDSSPALDSEGSLYFGSMYGGNGGYFQKYDQDGNRIWEENMLLWVLAKPLIGDEDSRFLTHSTKDVIFLGSEDGNFNAWYKNGTKKWQVMLGASVYGAAAIGPGVLWPSAPLHHPTLYVGTYVPANSHGIFFAISPVNGTVLWKYETTGLIKSSPAVSENGHIYVGTHDSKLYAFHPNGTVLWTFPLWGPGEGSPSVGKDGTIYVGAGEAETPCPATGCFFYAITPEGSLKWNYQLNPAGGNRRGACLTAPTIGADGTIYASCSDKIVYAFNPSGTLRWQHEVGGEVLSSPVVGPEGTVYFGSQDNKIYAIHRPCHPGYYCPVNVSEPIACDPGSYTNSTRAVTAQACAECDAGYVCGAATSTPIPCSSGEYCPKGSSVAAPCPTGFTCTNGKLDRPDQPDAGGGSGLSSGKVAVIVVASSFITLLVGVGAGIFFERRRSNSSWKWLGETKEENLLSSPTHNSRLSTTGSFNSDDAPGMPGEKSKLSRMSSDM